MTYLILHPCHTQPTIPACIAVSTSRISFLTSCCHLHQFFFCEVHLTVAKAGPCTGRAGRLLRMHTLPDASRRLLRDPSGQDTSY